MLLFSLIFILALFFVLMNYYIFSFQHRLFLSMFTISTIYYGVLGPWYWSAFRSGVMFETDWSDSFFQISLVYLIVYALVSVGIMLFGKKHDIKKTFKKNITIVNHTLLLEYSIIIVGLIACWYSYFAGGALIHEGIALTDDPILLISFQFADLPVGILLYWAAIKGINLRWLMIGSIYIAFAIALGYRIKLVILLFPILILLYFSPRKNMQAMRIGIFISVLLVIGLFSVMTIARVKFSGIDLGVLAEANADSLLLGLFAETNLVFGLASCLAIFGDKVPYAGFSPLTDVVVQFIPRFFYPEKDLYLHLKEIAWWIGQSKESGSSGTAIPFFGEYYAAFGWAGVGIGVFLYVMLTVYLLRIVGKYSMTYRHLLVGIGLAVLFMGYYYFSRGCMAQIFKTFLFIAGPYLYLSIVNYKKQGGRIEKKQPIED